MTQIHLFVHLQKPIFIIDQWLVNINQSWSYNINLLHDHQEKQIPKTQENTREADDTIVEPDDHEVSLYQSWSYNINLLHDHQVQQ